MFKGTIMESNLDDVLEVYVVDVVTDEGAVSELLDTSVLYGRGDRPLDKQIDVHYNLRKIESLKISLCCPICRPILSPCFLRIAGYDVTK